MSQRQLTAVGSVKVILELGEQFLKLKEQFPFSFGLLGS